MTVRRSTFLRKSMLGTNDIKTILAAGYIEIRSGAQPASSDSAATGTLLARIYSTGTTGVSFDAPVDNVLSAAAAETWSGVGLATGTAGWFRFYQFNSSYATSVTEGQKDDSTSKNNSRFDGSVSTSGADMNLSSVSIVSGVTVTIDAFSITSPEA